MNNKTSIAVSYWAHPLGGGKFIDFVEINEFEKDLSTDFNVFLRGRATDALGGGLYELVMVIFHNDTVHDTLLLIGGYLSDEVKDAAKEWLKKHIGDPIKTAFTKLKSRNEDKAPDIDRLEIVFKDVNFIIYNIFPDGIVQNIDVVLDLFGARLGGFISEGQLPSYVYVPVFHDKEAESSSWKKRPVYRKPEKIDETIRNVSSDDYLKYWGLFYTGQVEQCKVYEVRTKTFVNADLQSIEFGTF